MMVINQAVKTVLSVFKILIQRIFVTGDNEEGEEGEAGMDVEDGSPGAAASANQPGKPSHKPIRLNLKRHRALPNKPQDFQVLLKF